MPDNTSNRLSYTVRDFCAAVGIGRSKFYELVHDGKLRPVKLGAKTLVTAAEAERFISSLDEAAA